MNARDSAWLGAALRNYGFSEAPLQKASLVILNTCSVREKPEAKVRSVVRRIRQQTHAKIAVLGCVAQQAGNSLFDLDPGIILVAGGDALPRVPEKLLELLNEGAKESLLAIGSCYPEKDVIEEPLAGGSAFVNIMQGCSNYCSYCIVPFTRGPEKFRSAGRIIAECEGWLAKGASELVLLGQNVNVWQGEAAGKRVNFAWLLQRICELPGLARLRFITSHPRDLSDDIIHCFASLGPVCPALHLPLQSGSDTILAKMRRGYTAAEYISLVDNLRRAVPDIAFSTDLIVGFPGESKDDFKQTLALMQECGFVASYSFCYSDRPGTRASLMPDKISREESGERLLRLQELQEDITSRWMAGRVGETAELLIERKSTRGSSWQGRDIYGACVNVELPGSDDFTGKLIMARIMEAKRHSLSAVIASD